MLAIRYTHNDYIHIFSDYGAVGFGILLFGIAVFWRKMWRAANKLKRRNDRALAYGVLAAVIAILVHSLIDFNMHIPSNAMMMAAIVGLGLCIRNYKLNPGEEWVGLSARKKKLFPVALQAALVVVVIAAGAGLLYVNHMAYASFLTLHRAGEKDPSRDPSQEFRGQDPKEKDLSKADRLYGESASLFPLNSKPWAALANMHVWAADDVLEKEDRKNRFRFLLVGVNQAKKHYEKAAAAAKEAIQRNAIDSRYYLTLARAYAGIFYMNEEYKLGAPSQFSAALEKCRRKAEEQFQKALELDPKNVVYLDQRAFFFANIGRYDEAEEDLRDALHFVPRELKKEDKKQLRYWVEIKHLHERLGGVYVLMEKYDKAAKEIQAALDLLPEDGFSWEKKRLGSLLDDLRRKQKETPEGD
jgi:tetratricopeptide (TPR) repeat protein